MEATTNTRSLMDFVDFIQAAASRRIDSTRKRDLEQYFTSPPLARLMASMFQLKTDSVRILDPGAGAGILFAACVDALLQREEKPKRISVVAYELDASLRQDIEEVLKLCREACAKHNVEFEGEVIIKNFITDSAEKLGLSVMEAKRFNCVILNPPYRKLRNSSSEYRILRQLGLESPNSYTAFMEMAIHFLEAGGEMVSITPRSFCNGLYFKPFRKRFLNSMNIKRIHLFTSRAESFRDDAVLQENIILHCMKSTVQGNVTISSSEGPKDELFTLREVDAGSVVSPGDPEYFIRVVPDEIGHQVAERIESLTHTLKDLGLEVSTGRVVDFRSRDSLRYRPERDTVPLIHPANLNAGGYVRWPIEDAKKPMYFEVTDESKFLLVPKGNYVLVKRFTTNEEKKRVVAALYDSGKITAEWVAFENRVNYFHRNGAGIDGTIARGLTLFLNSTLVDSYFRQLSGHTQVNSTDLRNIKYPSLDQLNRLGMQVVDQFPEQKQIDKMVEKELFNMSGEDGISPIAAKQRISEALQILKELDLPREQLNERSALTLLALLDLKPEEPWSEAKRPMCGITPMMDFMAKNYGKKYAPNTRETVRRFTVHQFCQAGLTIENPDEPSRPTNSPKAVYQIESSAFDLLRSFGTVDWEANLKTYRQSVKSLREKYAREREQKMIPVKVSESKIIQLTPGGQNVLIQKIINDFLPRFVPEGVVVYVGDTGAKFAHFDEGTLQSLGVTIEIHGKMPDVIIYDKKRNWLFLVEAVTSHGPINPKRREELKKIFSKSKAGIVYVTTFLDRASMVSFLRDISWETEVWVAESLSHMIHFNGERFLGPYES